MSCNSQNVGAIAKHLNSVSGAYSLTAYLGDSAVSNPVAWPLGDVHFNFGQHAGGELQNTTYFNVAFSTFSLVD